MQCHAKLATLPNTCTAEYNPSTMASPSTSDRPEPAAPRSRRFGNRERLRQHAQFARVFAERCSAGDDLLVVYVVSNDLPWSRLGLRVGRKVGGAVRRSLVRRKVREAFRVNKVDLPTGFDIVCVARQKAADRSADVTASFCTLVVRASDRYRGRGCADRRRTSPDEAPK